MENGQDNHVISLLDYSLDANPKYGDCCVSNFSSVGPVSCDGDPDGD